MNVKLFLRVARMPLKPKLNQQVIEARYDRGYRYLDRTGEVLLIFDELLTAETGKLWLVEDASAQGTRLKCPELDLLLIFTIDRFILQQDPAEIPCDFDHIGTIAFASLSARFDLRSISRFGLRRMNLLITPSVEESHALSLRLGPKSSWPFADNLNSSARSWELTRVFETESRSPGMRFNLHPWMRIDAPIIVDERLKIPPHMQKENQRKALLDQLKRQKARQDSPDAGVMIDTDYYELNPKTGTLGDFLKAAKTEEDRYIAALLGDR